MYDFREFPPFFRVPNPRGRFPSPIKLGRSAGCVRTKCVTCKARKAEWAKPAKQQRNG